MKRGFIILACLALAGCATQMPRFRETITEYDDTGAVAVVTETVIKDTTAVLGKSSMKNVRTTVDYSTDEWRVVFNGGNEYMEGEELSPAAIKVIEGAVRAFLASHGVGL